jgi:hypothetical protein
MGNASYVYLGPQWNEDDHIERKYRDSQNNTTQNESSCEDNDLGLGPVANPEAKLSPDRYG